MSFETCYSPFILLQSFIYPLKTEASCVILLSEPGKIPNLGLWDYLPYLGLTCLMEAPTYWLGKKKSLSYPKVAFQILFLNAFSHPWVTWFFPWLGLVLGWPLQKILAVSEIFAFSSEALLLLLVYKYTPERAFLVAFVANLSSWWFGLYLI